MDKPKQKNNTGKLFFLPIIIASSFCLAIPIASANLAETECIAPKPMIKSLQIDWPNAPIGGYQLKPESTIADLVGYFFGWGIGLGGLAVFIALIIAGVEYITSVADPNKVNDAKKRIKSSLIGLVLLLSSWAIFRLLNPNLTKLTSTLPSIPQNQNRNFLLGDKECEQAIDCCNDASGNFDQTCIPKNWYCCRGNDTGCIEKGTDSITLAKGVIVTAGTNADWAECSKNTDCQNMNCGCNYGIDPSTGEKTTWKKICLPNPKMCVATSGAPEMGCDVVRFYSQPNFTGSSWDMDASAINSNWIYFPQGSVNQPRSYEAFSKVKDAKGNPTSDLQRCGFLACGCQINRCLDNTRGAGDDCVNQTSDKNSKEFLEWAYSENNLEYVTGVMVKDKTKQSAVTKIKNTGQNIIGAFRDLLGLFGL